MGDFVMKAALIILLITASFGAILFVLHKIGERRHSPAATDSEKESPSKDKQPEPQQECCGMHITCEKDSLLKAVSSEIVYYDDEELDAYRGIAPDAYSDEQIEEFRDILLTLLPEDIAGWARSLQLREINLPEIVKEELLLLVREERDRLNIR